MKINNKLRLLLKYCFVPKTLYHGTGDNYALNIGHQLNFLSSNKSKNENPVKNIDKNLIYFTPDIIEARKYSSVTNAKNKSYGISIFKLILPIFRCRFKYLLEHKIVDVYTVKDELKFDSKAIKRIYFLKIDINHKDYSKLQKLISRNDSSDLEKFLETHKDWKLLKQ